MRLATLPPMPLRRLLSSSLLAFVVCASCRVAEAKVWNLRQVHDPDGSPSYRGDIRTDMGWYLALALSMSRYDPNEGFSGIETPEKVRDIPDPREVCLENLIGLASCDAEDPRVLMQQVEVFAWLAKDDTYFLARERAALSLSDPGRRLGVTRPLPFDVETAAEPREVAVALTELVRNARPFLIGGEMASPRLLREACDGVRALALDFEGARRVVSGINAVFGSKKRVGALLELADLQREIAARLVAAALDATLSDPEPRVRAAGLQALVEMSANGDGALLLAALDDPSPLVVRRALRLVAAHGLPTPPSEADEGERLLERVAWTEALVERTKSLDGPVSIAACRALGKVSGAGPSLRPESWFRWWDATRRREAPAIEAALAKRP